MGWHRIYKLLWFFFITGGEIFLMVEERAAVGF